MLMADSPPGRYMLSYKILFPIETAARELLYKLTLAVRFAALGHECYVGSKREIYRLFSRVSPFVYFDKGYHPKASELIYEEVKRYGGLIVNLDEEGGVDFKHSKTIAARYPEQIFDLCDLIFLWGSAQYDFLKSERKNFQERKVVISGHPRFELLKPEFHGVYQADVERIKKKFGNYILLNTNMGFGNNIRGDEFVRENYGSRIHNLEKIMEFDTRKLQKIISLVSKLSGKTNSAIILRPHPEENQKIYQDAFKGLANVHVIYEGSVIPWLIGAEVMIHPDCTTGIESLMVGKRPVSLLPECDEELYTYAPVVLSRRFENENELIDFLIKKTCLYENENGNDSLLQNYFSFDNNSTDLIVREVGKLFDKAEEQPKKKLSCFYYMKTKVEYDVTFLYHRFVQNGSFLLQEKKLHGFKKNNVDSIFKSITWNSLEGYCVRLKSVNQYLYKIFS